MNEESTRFPDASRVELEEAISELVARADRCLVEKAKLRGLLDATRAVTEELELDRVLTRIAEAAVTLVGARNAALGVIDEHGKLKRFLHIGREAVTVPSTSPPPDVLGLPQGVIETGRSILLTSLNEDPRSFGFPIQHPPIRSFLGVPIRLRDEVYGGLYLTEQREFAFSAEDQDLIESLAVTAGVAIENARLYDEARRRQRLCTALSEMSSTLLSPGTSDVLGIVAEYLGRLVDGELVSIIVPADQERLRIDAARGFAQDQIEGENISAVGTVAARTIETGDIATGPFTENSALAELPPICRRLGPTAAVPLVAAGDTIGALCVSRGLDMPALTRTELTTLSEFAGYAGFAITLAWARQDRQRLEVAEVRSRIARDLHDHVIQRLFATGLGLQALAAKMPSHEAELVRYVEELDTAISDIRTVIFTLRSRGSSDTKTLVRHRLLDVVVELTPALATAPRITFAGPVDLALTGTLADDVVAVVRESLTNVTKHANAEQTVVSVIVTDSSVTITVEDDGDGPRLDPARASGIANLAERAAEYGGTFDLSPGSQRGATAQWSVPLINALTR